MSPAGGGGSEERPLTSSSLPREPEFIFSAIGSGNTEVTWQKSGLSQKQAARGPQTKQGLAPGVFIYNYLTSNPQRFLSASNDAEKLTDSIEICFFAPFPATILARTCTPFHFTQAL